MTHKELIFSEEFSAALKLTKKIASGQNHSSYQSAHLLKSILHRDFSLLKKLEKMGIDVYFMEEWAEVRLEECPKTMIPVAPKSDESIEAIIEEADAIRKLTDKDEIDLFSIMVALATPGVGFNFDQIKTFPVTRAELLNEVNNEGNINKELLNLPTERAISKLLYKYCTNKSVQRKNKKTEIVGREKDLNEIVEILCRFSKPNVLLQGYSGVGKSALIDGFVDMVNQKQVPDKLLETEVFELEMGTLLAGASSKGEVEDRLKKTLQELRNYPKSILVIDGIHLLLDKNTENAGVSSILKSEISKGLTLIATTTIDEYTKKIEKDEQFSGMFERIKVEEPSSEKAFRILKTAIRPYVQHHKLKISDETIHEAVTLAKRYLKDKSLPESALNLMDRTMSVIKTAGESFLKEKKVLSERLDELKLSNDKQEITWYFDDLKQKAHYLLTQEKIETPTLHTDVAETIAYLEELIHKLTVIAETKKEHIAPIDLRAIVAQKTGIPLGKLQQEEKERLLNMDSILKKRVVGQHLAIQTITDAMMESRSGLQKAGQPMGSFFFLGPTGTGKTELAKALADFMFQDENAIIRFDMSEFKEEHSAALLYGAPPGYVGYEEGGLLVNKIRQQPYSIVLFDEIEKAHSSVFDVFLQIMDEGKLHDRLGKEGDFSNALILFTSNIGADFIVKSVNSGEGYPTSNQLIDIMARHFRPEFLGRLTEIVPFGPITKENAMGIFEIHLKKELQELIADMGFQLEITQSAKEYLVENGFNATYGARPIKGIIRSELRRPLAKKIIAGTLSKGDKMLVSLNNDKLIWEIES